ncbi:ral guanine nucleotide dissociation stimulator-like 1 [Sinocyclocheilus anshuiensis]|uniref:ral guanine nucleotide dissociation stimulator-like 1 n=1 Tax=Sinocyclocheilus anshuiensis TaxID=1608454 RepID=UPI0007BA7A96|nr:PREDICTED: ral guanine nucleotide dissociation stimulator-like 1 [Sinocyclocheilus anshuiensis]
MGKRELTMEPVQEWGEEHENGAVFGITLRREPVQQSADPTKAFVQYRTCKVRRLKAATLDKLVSHLLDPCCQEQDYGRILLSTYRTFTSSNKLIEMLLQRGNLVSALDSTNYPNSSLWTVLQMWLEEYSDDLRDAPMHSSLRLMCLQLRGHPALFPLAKRYETLLRKFQAEDVVAGGPVDHLEESALNKERDFESDNLMDFLSFSITDVAEQLTRMDADLFMKVVPFQCLGCVWSQRDKKENLSPTIWATIAQFNAVTSWVITSLLRSSSSATQRAKIIEKWVRIAQGCRELKNFSSLKAILSALQSNPIYRLRKTWAALSREAMSVFENLCETFPDENCVLTSREIFVDDGSQADMDNTTTKTSKRCPLTKQMSSAGGTVPYLGTYLTVLTMLDTALPDTVEGGLINFEKRRREHEILRQIRQLQASCSQYVLPHHPQIAAWLQSQKLLSDQESYEFSRQLETPQDTSPSNSGWSHRTLTKKLSSLLSGNEGSKKNSDQISVSSSGSSSSETEEISAAQSSSFLSPALSSCSQNTEAFPSSSSPDSSTVSSSSSSSQQDLILNPSSSSSSSSASADPHLVSSHKRSVSMTSLPFYNRQVDDSCIIRVSVEFCNNGNMYKSILLTSQDKTAQVIQRALQKHNLEDVSEQDFTLVQVLAQGRELHIPEKANVYYAMSTSANYDFVLRRCPKGQRKQLIRSVSLSSGRATK